MLRGRHPQEILQAIRKLLGNAPRVPEKLFHSVIAAFERADQAARQRFTERLTSDSRNALLGYASDLAVLAVRRNSPELVRLGLLALAVEGGTVDIRDSIVGLAKLYHSAMKLGVDAAATFRDVAALTPVARLRSEMSGFPSRPPEYRELPAFWLREQMTDDGFVYEMVWPTQS